jgi:integrase
MRKEFGAAYHDLGEHGPLVFAQPDGKPLHMHNLVRRTFKDILEDAKLPAAVRLHDLRHGFATFHAQQGTSVRAVADLLGHSSPAFTLSVYQHAFRREKDTANRLLAERLLGSPSNESSNETVSPSQETAGTHEKETA